MFIELMPLIERRAITITVAALNEGRIRVDVVPTALAEDSRVNDKMGYSNKDKIAQITRICGPCPDHAALSNGSAG
jgi:hypothetical protein